MPIVKTTEGQSLFDVAVQFYGSVEYVIQIILDNGRSNSINTPIPVGTELYIRSNKSAVATYFSKQGLQLATKPDDPVGIGYWIIGNTFIIS